MKKYVIVFFFLFSLSAVFAQGSSGLGDVISNGMGKTYVTTSTGIYALGKNPANLIYGDESAEFTPLLPIPNISLNLGTSFMSIEEYNYFFGWEGEVNAEGKKVGKKLTDADKERFVALFDDGGKISSELHNTYLALVLRPDPTFGAIGFSITDVVAFHGSVPQTFADLVMNGNTKQQLYNFNGLDAAGWFYRKYNLSYARELDFIEQDIFKQISVGIGLNLISGFAYSGIERMNTYLEMGPYNEIKGQGDFLGRVALSEDFGVKYDFDSLSGDKKSNMGPFPKAAGSGFGVDFGVSLVLDESFTFALSLTDLGSITWDQNIAEYTSSSPIYVNDILDKEQLDSLGDDLKGKGKFGSSFSTTLASALHLGASMKMHEFFGPDDFPGKMIVALEYHQGFNDMPGNSKTPRVSLGMDWDPGDYIPFIRTGFSFGGYDGFNWGFGIGTIAGPVELSLSTTDFHSAFRGSGAKRVSVSFGSRFRI